VNVTKLQDEMLKATAEKADSELDRMIALHEGEVAKNKEVIKRYLLALAITPGKTPDYTLASTANVPVTIAVSQLSIHKQIVKDLEKLRAELE
jgi:hypothetical protein